MKTVKYTITKEVPGEDNKIIKKSFTSSITLINEVKTKHARKIFPLVSKITDENEVDIMLDIAEALFIEIDGESDVEKYRSFIDELSMEDLASYMVVIWELIEQQDKKK